MAKSDSKQKTSSKQKASNSASGQKAQGAGSSRAKTRAKAKATVIESPRVASNNLVRKVTFEKARRVNFPSFRSGDTVNVYVRVREGEKERIQLYRGLVIKIQGSGMGRSFTVRKMSSGVGVERTFPYLSPAIDRVELVSAGQVRRAKLFYLRKLKGKAAAIEAELAAGLGELEAEASAAGATETSAPAAAQVEESGAEKA